MSQLRGSLTLVPRSDAVGRRQPLTAHIAVVIDGVTTAWHCSRAFGKSRLDPLLVLSVRECALKVMTLMNWPGSPRNPPIGVSQSTATIPFLGIDLSRQIRRHNLILRSPTTMVTQL